VTEDTLSILARKLEHLENELAYTIDPGQKFSVKEQIKQLENDISLHKIKNTKKIKSKKSRISVHGDDNAEEFTVKSSDEGGPRILGRGAIIGHLVDATFLLQPEGDDAKIAKDAIREGEIIPNWLFYSSDLGALSWVNLCNDPDYDVFQDSATFINSNKNNILEACGRDFLRCSPDYISLGPGNGYKDKFLLNALLGFEKAADLFYYPIDISLFMLSRAIQTLIAEPDIADVIKIKAVRSHFDKINSLKPVFDFRDEPNLYVFLGNTLGNMVNESHFLLKLRHAMSDEDRAIIEVRLKTEHNDRPGGATHLREEFTFTPLKLAGIKPDRRKLVFSTQRGFSVVPNATTIVGEYHDFYLDRQKIESAKLSCIHHYGCDDLRSFFEHKGFKVIQDFKNEKTALFVLSKSDKSRS